MNKRKLSFSLVIATLNRVSELDALFLSLVAQTKPPYEVILVDQNKDERLFEIIDKYKDKLPINRIEATSEGASRARNIGKKHATGDVVTFPDDDCEYPPDLLSTVESVLQENPQFDAVTVRSKDKNKGAITRFSSRKKFVNRFNIFRTMVESGIFFRQECIAGYDFNETLGVGALTPYWSDEGADLLVRMLSSGIIICFYPDLFFYHEDPVKLYDQQAWLRSSRYGCGRGRYLRLHKYPWWFVLYTWGTYLGGACVYFVLRKPGRSRYYWEGFKTRLSCYFHKI